MKLAVVNLTSGGMSGGYRKYLQKLIPLMAKDSRVSSIDVLLPQQLSGLNGRTFESRSDLDRLLGALKPDVIFIPTARYVRSAGIPTVVMLRNMEPVDVPFGGNPLPEALRNLARREVARRACSRATRVIAVSRHVEDVLVRRWKIDPAHVGLVYHGVDDHVREAVRPPGIDDLASRPFIFTAGSIRPARGLEDLLEARLPIPLVIAGAPDPPTRKYAQRLERKARESGADVRWLGKVSAEGISWCLRNCAVFVMTSRAEACPNTVLEAMSHGSLSVSTDTAPMPEFFSDSAYYYHARNPRRLEAVLQQALAADTATKERHRSAARARAAEFSWEQTAVRTVDELMKAVSKE